MERNADPTNELPAWHRVLPGDLAMLIRTVELGSFSAVARERNLPTSSVSRAVQRLESAWAVRLLRRSTHGLSLTPEGEVAVDLGRQSLASLAEIGERLGATRGQISGTVRLALSASFAEGLVVPALPALAARHPELAVDLLVDDKASDFTLDGVDLAVRVGSVVDESLVARPIGSFRRGLYASPDYLRRHGTPGTPDALAGHVFVAHQSVAHLNRLRFVPGSGHAERTVVGRYRANTTAVMEEMVRQGLGIGYLNELFMRSRAQRGEVVEILAEWCDPARYPIYAVYLPDRQRLPRVQAVIEFLGELFAPELPAAGAG